MNNKRLQWRTLIKLKRVRDLVRFKEIFKTPSVILGSIISLIVNSEDEQKLLKHSGIEDEDISSITEEKAIRVLVRELKILDKDKREK